MAVEKAYRTDAEAILSHRWDNGGDLWATPDKRLLKGAPFSALESPLYLLELGMEPGDPLMHQVAALFFSVWQEDGRFKMYPQGGIYPCQTIHAADLLCHLGYAGDARLQRTWRHLLDTQCADGGWRCLKFSFGRGPETAYSNPYPTLVALDAFRFTDRLNREPALDRAVEFLLDLFKYSAALSSSRVSGALSIVGGLLIGDIAVSLNWASTEVLFYAAVTMLANLSLSSIEFADALRIYRILLVVTTGLWGLPGFIIGLTLVSLSMITTPTFAGFSYFWPLFPFNGPALRSLLFRRPTYKAQPSKVWSRGHVHHT